MVELQKLRSTFVEILSYFSFIFIFNTVDINHPIEEFVLSLNPIPVPNIVPLANSPIVTFIRSPIRKIMMFISFGNRITLRLDMIK